MPGATGPAGSSGPRGSGGAAGAAGMLGRHGESGRDVSARLSHYCQRRHCIAVHLRTADHILHIVHITFSFSLLFFRATLVLMVLLAALDSLGPRYVQS